MEEQPQRSAPRPAAGWRGPNRPERHSWLTPVSFSITRRSLFCAAKLPWCTTPIEADSSLGPDSHHPIISLSGIPSAVMVLRILHPILASTLCAANLSLASLSPR